MASCGTFGNDLANPICFQKQAGDLSRVEGGDSGGPWVAWYNGYWVELGPEHGNDSVYSNTDDAGSVGQAYPRSLLLAHTNGEILAPANQTIVQDTATGNAWLVGSDGFRRSIPTGGDYLCFANAWHDPLVQSTLFDIETIPEYVGATATCTPPAPTPTTYPETTGGTANTWTNYTNAGGTQGPTIPAFATVQIACKLTGWTAPDGNNWWYQIAQSPWSNQYYVSADAFYNNGATSGSLLGTPFFDPNVATCAGSPPPPPPNTYAETTGGVTHTWTNYTNAGGTQGSSIPSNATVQIACRLTGWTAPDGNNWWYRIASSPWNSSYYASADAFYNNGATSGSLVGTPFVDTNVALC